MRQAYKQVPYGVSDFITVVTQNLYYVDKTMYIPQLEEEPRFLFFTRPRRFGKSLFINMLRAYYDSSKKKISKPFSEISGLASIPLRCKVLFRSSILISRRWVEALMSLKKDSMNIVASV